MFVMKNTLNLYVGVLERFLKNDIYPLIRRDTAENLAEPMVYALDGGGKRLRPVMLLLASGAEFQKEDPESAYHELSDRDRRALYGASAVECLHTYSLVHDDLPAMDNDDLRRGRPSCHKAFTEYEAILAGDALNSFSFEILSQAVSVEDGPKLAPLLKSLARGGGMSGMVSGQSYDLLMEKRPEDLKLNNSEEKAQFLETIHRKKTAALIRSAMEMGGILAGFEPDEINLLGDYGEDYGLLFQITDDILDITGDSKDLGKSVGKDANAGKLTYPSLYGLDRSRKMAVEIHNHLMSLVDDFPQQMSEHPHKSFFRELGDYTLKRNK